MEVTGTLKVKFDTQKVSERFQKRDFVLTTETNTPYPQYVSFQLTQDKVNLLDQYHEGDEMKVHFNLRGREWNGPQGIKYFNTLEAWRIERAQTGSAPAQPARQQQAQSSPAQEAAPAFNSNISDNDDLPF